MLKHFFDLYSTKSIKENIDFFFCIIKSYIVISKDVKAKIILRRKCYSFNYSA